MDAANVIASPATAIRKSFPVLIVVIFSLKKISHFPAAFSLACEGPSPCLGVRDVRGLFRENIRPAYGPLVTGDARFGNTPKTEPPLRLAPITQEGAKTWQAG